MALVAPPDPNNMLLGPQGGPLCPPSSFLMDLLSGGNGMQ